MRLLLDTHVLLWWLAGDPRLGTTTQEAIGDHTNDVLVSAASAWEMSVKVASGRLSMPADLVQELRRQGISELAVGIEDGLAAGALPRHHDDPFDRLLIAQARRHGLVMASADSRFGDYDVALLR